ncbi:MAG: hypothetical protein OHK0029_13440 [Armatimonadaceae bacterium]
MSEETESGFTVRDRRRFLRDTEETIPAAEEATPQTPEPPTPQPEASAKPGAVQSESASSSSGAGINFPFPGAPAAESGGGFPFGGFGGPAESDADFAEGPGGYEGFGGMEEEAVGEIPDIYTVLLEFLGIVRIHAALRMGLVPNPTTGKVERDLGQAKVAIDTAAFLVEQLEPVVMPEERLPLRALLSDLQMQFVQQTKQS